MRDKFKKVLSRFKKNKIEEKPPSMYIITKTHGDIEIPLDDINIILVKTRSIENVFLMGLKSLSNYSLKIGDGVLLTNQESLKENGVYEVNQGYWRKINLPENKYNIIIVTQGLFLDTKYLIHGNDYHIDELSSIIVKAKPKSIELLNHKYLNIIDLRHNSEATNICERK